MQSFQCLGLQHVNFSISHSSVWSWVTWVNLLLTVTRSTWCVVIISSIFHCLVLVILWNQVHYARSWPCLLLIFYSFLNNYDIIVVNCYFLLCNSHVISIACCRLNFCKNRQLTLLLKFADSRNHQLDQRNMTTFVYSSTNNFLSKIPPSKIQISWWQTTIKILNAWQRYM